MSVTTTQTFRWDRLTYASALGYALLVAGLSVGAVLGQLREEFHLSGLVASLHGSTFGVGLLAVGVWGVAAVDRIGRRTALAASAAAMTAGVVLFCTGRIWPLTLGGTVLAGFGGAMLVMIMPGLISDHHGEHRAAAFAAVNGAPGIAGVSFSLIIGGTLAVHWSWRPPYLLLTMVILVVLAAVAYPVVVPESAVASTFTLAHFGDRDVFVPWLQIVNAVLAEFSIAFWATSYLKEVGHASGGQATALAGVFGVSMFVSRLMMPAMLRLLGESALSIGFVVLASGSLLMCLGPGLLPRVAGLAIVGFGGAPLYPLTVARLYESAEHKIDSVSLGAICALASGAAITLGPLSFGLLADRVGLQRAILIAPVIAVLGAVSQRPPRRD